MNISFSTLGCPRWSWAEICATACDLGYDGVEVRGVGKDISVPTIPQFSEDQIEDTRSNLRRLGLTIPCLTSDCCLHLREQAERTEREVMAYALLAKSLGVSFIRVMGAAALPQPIGQIDVGFVREQAQRLGEMVAPYHVTLLLETNAQWADSEKLARLLDDVHLESVAALWDIHHPYRFMHERPHTTYANLKPWIRHTHLKDSRPEGDGEHVRYCLPGFGDIPLEEAIGLLRDGAYAGFFSLEWVKRWDLTLEEPGIVFAHYVHFMRSFA